MNDENIEGLSDALDTDFKSEDLPMRKQTEVNIVPLDSVIMKEGELSKIGKRTKVMRSRYYILRD